MRYDQPFSPSAFSNKSLTSSTSFCVATWLSAAASLNRRSFAVSASSFICFRRSSVFFWSFAEIEYYVFILYAYYNAHVL